MEEEGQLNLQNLNAAIEARDENLANSIMDSGVEPDIESLNLAIKSGSGNLAIRILNLGVEPEVENLEGALDAALENVADRILEFVEPDVDCLHIAINDDRLQNIANRILNEVSNLQNLKYALSGGLENVSDAILNLVTPDLECFAIAIDNDLLPASNRILNLGVQPTTENLNSALIGEGLEDIAKRILDMGVQPNMKSLENALNEELYEIAEEVILPSLSQRNIEPDESIPVIKSLMDHKRSEENLKTISKDKDLGKLSILPESSRLNKNTKRKIVKLGEKLRALETVSREHLDPPLRKTKKPRI